MSKWLEYVKLVTKIKDPLKVVEGVVNSVKNSYGLLPEDEQEEIIRRLLICKECPNMSANRQGAKQKGFDYCTLCSCPISSKTASMSSSCGATTYNERHPEDVKPILWEKYIKK